MNIPLPVSDWELETNTWNIEGYHLRVDAVSVLHPTIQFGLMAEFYRKVLPAELYGTIRSWKPAIMLVTPTDPICIALLYASHDEIDFFNINWDEYEEFKRYFLGQNDQNKNWFKDGF